jgi:hypothetical protein
VFQDGDFLRPEGAGDMPDTPKINVLHVLILCKKYPYVERTYIRKLITKATMSNTLTSFYHEIKERLTIEHLKRITIDIIDSYKNRNFNQLKKYASVLEMDSETHHSKLFSVLIKKFHPDRISFILKQVDELYQNKDINGLTRLRDSFFFNIAAVRSVPDTNFEFEQEYAFDEEDFGYKEADAAEPEDFGETELDFGEEEHRFMDAVHRLFAGGLDLNITASDLMDLEGALDLSDFDIDDLEGVQHCVYVNELNLSNNRIEKIGGLSGLTGLFYLFLANNQIENISPLKGLVHLKELDISFNNISDISVLEKLEELEYVNLLGNPVRDYSVVDRLMKKGIIVIFEGNILT